MYQVQKLGDIICGRLCLRVLYELIVLKRNFSSILLNLKFIINECEYNWLWALTTIIKRERTGLGFQYDEDNNFDIDNKKIVIVANPEEEQDVITKVYTDNLIMNLWEKFQESVDDSNLRSLKLSETVINNTKKYLHVARESVNIEEDKLKLNIRDLENQIDDINKKLDKVDYSHCHETIFFQTNVKLESGKFPFVLGMKGPSNKNTGFVVP